MERRNTEMKVLNIRVSFQNVALQLQAAPEVFLFF